MGPCGGPWGKAGRWRPTTTSALQGRKEAETAIGATSFGFEASAWRHPRPGLERDWAGCGGPPAHPSAPVLWRRGIHWAHPTREVLQLRESRASGECLHFLDKGKAMLPLLSIWPWGARLSSSWVGGRPSICLPCLISSHAHMSAFVNRNLTSTGCRIVLPLRATRSQEQRVPQPSQDLLMGDGLRKMPALCQRLMRVRIKSWLF